jgi:hypothetical protein
MRFARLELSLNCVLQNSDPWRKLCDLWAQGLQGLRLRILLKPATHRQHDQASESEKEDIPDVIGILDGLRKLKALRWLEVEFSEQSKEVSTLTNDVRLEWCADLCRLVNEGRTDGKKTRVLGVETSKSCS